MTIGANAIPQDIWQAQVAIDVRYINFVGVIRSGTIEVNQAVHHDVEAFFEHALSLGFPIELVASASYCEWDDERLMRDNISSGFNYRTIVGKTTLSPHAYGMAFDINPRRNPYIRYEDGNEIVAPSGATWDPSQPGTLNAKHPLVKLMLDRGWEWGGNWGVADGRVDYQHFVKLMQ